MNEDNNQASPSPEQFEDCLRVLRWMRDGDHGLHESWQIPLTHICGCVRGCLEISKAERAGGRKPTASKITGTKHVGISDGLGIPDVKSKTPGAHFEPTGVKWKSERGTEFILVTSGHHKDWVCYRHPDGQWVTSHEPSSIDRLKILDELKALRHG